MIFEIYWIHQCEIISNPFILLFIYSTNFLSKLHGAKETIKIIIKKYIITLQKEEKKVLHFERKNS